MLVLSRQRDETIMIGNEIEVTVVDIRGDKVRLGINAPKETSVHRKEVYDASSARTATRRPARPQREVRQRPLRQCHRWRRATIITCPARAEPAHFLPSGWATA
jgi:carbon storage regulator